MGVGIYQLHRNDVVCNGTAPFDYNKNHGIQHSTRRDVCVEDILDDIKISFAHFLGLHGIALELHRKELIKDIALYIRNMIYSAFAVDNRSSIVLDFGCRFDTTETGGTIKVHANVAVPSEADSRRIQSYAATFYFDFVENA